MSGALLRAQIQELTEAINANHVVHKEQHQLTGMYRTICSCGWKSREYGNGDGHNPQREMHLRELIQKAVDIVKGVLLCPSCGNDTGCHERGCEEAK